MDALIQSLVQANFAPERIAPQASMAQYTTLRIGGPTARDMLELMRQVEQRVFEQTGVQLEPEVRILGED